MASAGSVLYKRSPRAFNVFTRVVSWVVDKTANKLSFWDSCAIPKIEIEQNEVNTMKKRDFIG